MAKRDMVVIGGSAGALGPLRRIASGLPPSFPGAVFVVQHIPATARSVLPALLTRAGPLPAFHPEDGEPIRPGHIHVAPPDRHLLVKEGRVMLSRGPHENRVRPAIDVLFRSAAVAYGPRVVGVVLSGLLDDGTAGLQAIKRCGGLAVVQDPADAAWPGMPGSAVRHVEVDHAAAARDLASLLVASARTEAPPALPVPADVSIETSIAGEEDPMGTAKLQAAPSGLSCPECHGSLMEVKTGSLLRFRCRVGHAYSAKSLIEAEAEAVERAMWIAMRTQEERAQLYGRLAAHARERGRDHLARRWDDAEDEAHQMAESIREVLARNRPAAEDAEAEAVAEAAGGN